MLVLPVLALHVCESTDVAAIGVVRRERAPESVRGEVPAREKLFAPPAFDEAGIKHLLRPRRGRMVLGDVLDKGRHGGVVHMLRAARAGLFAHVDTATERFGKSVLHRAPLA